MTHQIQPSGPLLFHGEEVLAAGYDAIWFLFKGAPYDVARLYRPDGTWTGYYADILEPVQWEGTRPDTLRPMVDLFLDLWIAPDGQYEVLDEQELADAIRSGWITEAQAETARHALNELCKETDAGRFPPRLVRDWVTKEKVSSRHCRDGRK